MTERFIRGDATDAESPSRAKAPEGSELLYRLYEDYAKKAGAGEEPDPESIIRKYPHLRDELQELLGRHGVIVDELGGYALEPPSEEEWPQVGDTFLSFLLLETLGVGGFSRVFLAADTRLGNRPVVVKISYFGGAEAQLAGPLDHPNVMRVESVHDDRDSGLTVLCMPYTGTDTLEEVCSRIRREGASRQHASVLWQTNDVDTGSKRTPAWLRGLSFIDGVRLLIARVADGLAYVHEHNICHRDVKPSNIVIEPDGNPVLIDFNMATRPTWGAAFVGGTFAYMAPELLLAFERDERIEPPTIDARCDVFSLGVILYELLSGSHPFGPIDGVDWKDPRAASFMRDRQSKGCHRLRESAPHVDERLCRLVDRCLALDAGARPQTATELAGQLRRLPFRRRALNWILRYPLLAAALALVFSVAAVWGGITGTRALVQESDLEKGLQSYRQEKYEQAAEHLTQAIAKNPKRKQALLIVRARSYMKLGFKKPIGAARDDLLHKAQEDLQQALKMAPCKNALVLLGHLHQRKGGIQLARHYYERAVKRGVQSAAVHNNLGRICYQQADADTALANLNKAIKLDPNCQAALHNRALVYTMQYLKLRSQALIDKKQAIPVQLQLQCAVRDISRATAGRMRSGALYRDAARIHAYLSQTVSGQETTTLEYAKQAVSHGISAKYFNADIAFQHLRDRPEFLQLAKLKATPTSRQRAIHVLEPEVN